MSQEKSSFNIDWKTVALIGTPIALVGLAGFYIYYTRDEEERQKKIKKDERAAATGGFDSGTESEDPLTRAVAFKNRGNKYFKAGKYHQAIECYTQALDIAPDEAGEDRATFYQNRAAAHENMGNFEKALEDTTAALVLTPRYVKALTRRARMYEKLDRLEDCLEDVTAVCIFESFGNQENLGRADRVLKLVGKRKATEEFGKIVPTLPSDAFVRTYFSAFASDPFFKFSEERRSRASSSGKRADPSSENGNSTHETDGEGTAPPVEESSQSVPGEATLVAACEALVQGRYQECMTKAKQAVTELEESKTSGVSVGGLLVMARLLRGTFYILVGQTKLAQADLLAVIGDYDAEKEVAVNGLIKSASLAITIEQDIAASMNFFKRAIELWPDCPDIFHHRGQINLLSDSLDQAKKDLDKAVKLKPDYAITQSQRVYTSYRIAFSQKRVSEAEELLKEFQQLTIRFPKCMETRSLYAQALVDQERFDEADAQFKAVIDLDPTSGTAYVHRGLLQMRSGENLEKAMELIKLATEVDPKCEFAHEMLGTLYVQRAEFTGALNHFNKAIQLTKTEMEACHLVSLREAVLAQMRVCTRFGITIPEMLAVHGGLMAQGAS